MVCRPDAEVAAPQPCVPLPPIADTKRWKVFCFGKDGNDAHTAAAAAAADGNGTGSTPTVHVSPPAGVGHGAGSEDDSDSDEGGDDTAAGTEVAAAPQEPPSAVSDGVDAITAAGAGMPPYVSILTALDHVSAVKLLERHIRRVCSTQGSIPPAYMLWMYGLLARTDLPVAPDTASSLRALLKHCCRLRAQACERAGERAALPPEVVLQPGSGVLGAQEPQEPSSKRARSDEAGHVAPDATPGLRPPPDGLSALNVIIVLLHRVFGQLEPDT